MRVVRAVGIAPRAVSAALLVALVAVGLRKLGIAGDSAARLAIMTSAGLALGAVVVGWLWPLPERDAARVLDRFHSLHDRLSSALAFSFAQGAAADAALHVEAAIADAVVALLGCGPAARGRSASRAAGPRPGRGAGRRARRAPARSPARAHRAGPRGDDRSGRRAGSRRPAGREGLPRPHEAGRHDRGDEGGGRGVQPARRRHRQPPHRPDRGVPADGRPRGEARLGERGRPQGPRGRADERRPGDEEVRPAQAGRRGARAGRPRPGSRRAARAGQEGDAPTARASTRRSSIRCARRSRPRRPTPSAGARRS